MNPKQKKMLYRILIAAVLLVLIQLLPLTGLLEMVPVPHGPAVPDPLPGGGLGRAAQGRPGRQEPAAL